MTYSFAVVAAVLNLIVPIEPGPPNLTIKYENPIYAANYEHGESFDHYGARWFDFWKGGSGFAHIPQPTEAKNCLSVDLHFCVHLAQFVFAAPHPGAKPGARWRVGRDVEFRLLSIRTVRFRGRDIEAYLIKGNTHYPDGGRVWLASVFSYNHDWGVLGYADVWSESYSMDDSRSPVNLERVSSLASEHGLGGRENCKYWMCGPLPK